MIDLYYYTSPNVRKVLITLEELGLPYEIKWTDITAGDQFSASYLQVNPNGKVPAIVDHDGPGGRPLPLFESAAILLYLAEKTGQLLPADPERDQHLPDVRAGVVVEVDHVPCLLPAACLLWVPGRAVGRRSDAELGLHAVEVGHQVGLGLHVAGTRPGVRLQRDVLQRRVHRSVQGAEPVAGEVPVVAQVVRERVDVGAEEDLDHL